MDRYYYHIKTENSLISGMTPELVLAFNNRNHNHNHNKNSKVAVTIVKDKTKTTWLDLH